MPKPPLNNADSSPFLLFCDGASRGNPGPAAYGFVIFQNQDVLEQKGGRLGNTTNNVAEYQGLIHGLKRLVELGAKQIVVKADSEFMVRQLNGIYKVKAPNIIPLFQQAKALLENFEKAQILHVRREENSLADAMANEALDRP